MPAVTNVFTYPVDYGNAGLQPAPASYWRSFGPSDVYKDSVVVITAIPSTLVAGATYHRAMALQVTDTFFHQYPFVSGDILRTEAHVGVWVQNTGQFPIRYVTFKVAVIKA